MFVAPSYPASAESSACPTLTARAGYNDEARAPGVELKELRALDSLLSLRPSLARRLVVLARKA